MEQYSLSQRFQGALLGCTIGQQNATPIDFTPCLNWLCHQGQPPSLGTDPITNAIALLPLWLYTHESWRQRQNHLEQLPHWSAPQTDQAPLWLYAEAIAQTLRPQTKLTDLIANLPDRWQQHARHGAPDLTPAWSARLTQLHQWQQQRWPIAQIQADLTDCPAPERAIVASLFCGVSAAADWSIAQRQLTQLIGAPDPRIGGLLGGLWGAYYGWNRLPIDRILPFTNQADHPMVIPCTAASQQLLQTWSGNIQPSHRAAPIVLGPR